MGRLVKASASPGNLAFNGDRKLKDERGKVVVIVRTRLMTLGHLIPQ